MGLDEGWAERAEVYTRRIRVPYPLNRRPTAAVPADAIAEIQIAHAHRARPTRPADPS